ncbi:MAG: cytochrome ubiquinol oxidase subunit I [Solirubrobacterales bacterium]|nr:cytochrome ubiquinol oxidase subunit I [Solirubrobacterales bacterium]HMT05874.1 cytochrome ubiquinol oxidase subunit I [Solirubrobacterales bacterium]
MPIAETAVDLARLQFATTSIYHFFFVPLTLGLAPIVAVMQTIWYRTGDDLWYRMTRFFGTLFLINFAIGVATGIVQEFQFGMNWATYSAYVGDVFGAPLAIEGLAAFFLESVFLGLWIFGWELLPKTVHLAMIWIAAVGTWLSAYFILVANSWMQHPVGYEVTDGKAHLTDVWAVLSQPFAINAFAHTMLVGLSTAALFVFGIACWHLLKGKNAELFRKAAAIALIVAVPATGLNLMMGSAFGITTTNNQPMKIAGSEALWETEQPASFSIFQVGGFSADDQTPGFSVEVPGLLSFLATGTFNGKVEGLNQVQASYEKKYGPGDYLPPVKVNYWSMRVMAYVGTLMFLVAALGALFFRRGTLEKRHGFLKVAVGAIALPYIAATAGWLLTEMGRQPWIVQGLLKTADANSPGVSSGEIIASLGVFVLLYSCLAVADISLMRRHARLDPPPAPGDRNDRTALEPA